MVCITLESAVPLNGSGSFISTPRRARVPSPLVCVYACCLLHNSWICLNPASEPVVPSACSLYRHDETTAPTVYSRTLATSRGSGGSPAAHIHVPPEPWYPPPRAPPPASSAGRLPRRPPPLPRPCSGDGPAPSRSSPRAEAALSAP
jgi:hypothetical protein